MIKRIINFLLRKDKPLKFTQGGIVKGRPNKDELNAVLSSGEHIFVHQGHFYIRNGDGVFKYDLGDDDA